MALFLPLPGYADWPEEDEQRLEDPAAVPDMWTLESDEPLPTVPIVPERVEVSP